MFVVWREPYAEKKTADEYVRLQRNEWLRKEEKELREGRMRGRCVRGREASDSPTWQGRRRGHEGAGADGEGLEGPAVFTKVA